MMKPIIKTKLLRKDKFYTLNKEVIENLNSVKREIKEIDKWLADNDWKVNKIILKEWEETDPRWLDYVSKREIYRKRRDEAIKRLVIKPTNLRKTQLPPKIANKRTLVREPEIKK